MAYAIQLPWKPFNVSLSKVEQWAKDNLDNYVGNSADYQLSLWFSVEPTEYQKQIVQDYWDSIDETSIEATSYVPQSAISSAISTLKAGLVNKTWDEMSVAERKLVLNQTPTQEELGL